MQVGFINGPLGHSCPHSPNLRAPIHFSMGPPFLKIHMVRKVILEWRYSIRWLGTVEAGIEFRWDSCVPHGDLL
jgi:hypothetical protein